MFSEGNLSTSSWTEWKLFLFFFFLTEITKKTTDGFLEILKYSCSWTRTASTQRSTAFQYVLLHAVEFTPTYFFFFLLCPTNTSKFPIFSEKLHFLPSTLRPQRFPRNPRSRKTHHRAESERQNSESGESLPVSGLTAEPKTDLGNVALALWKSNRRPS